MQSRGLCFEKHDHFLVLQKKMSLLNTLHKSFLTIYQEHIIEVAALQKHREDTFPVGKSMLTDGQNERPIALTYRQSCC